MGVRLEEKSWLFIVLSGRMIFSYRGYFAGKSSLEFHRLAPLIFPHSRKTPVSAIAKLPTCTATSHQLP